MRIPGQCCERVENASSWPICWLLGSGEDRHCAESESIWYNFPQRSGNPDGGDDNDAGSFIGGV